MSITFGAFAILWIVAGLLRKPKRAGMWTAALCAAAAGIAAHYDAFWPMASFGLLMLWMAIIAAKFIDAGWSARAGLTLVVALTGFLVLWPSLDVMSDGKVPCPRWVEQRIKFRLTKGLDLSGGLRLVYSVDVEEAIKDKRDRYYEDMKVELAKVYGLHTGSDRPSEATYEKLREKVEIEAPRSETNVIRLAVKPGADPGKIDARFIANFQADLSYTRSPDQRNLTFSIRDRAETAIRDSAVGQAREIILRRVDELGLREAAVSTRDEDIIVEVPGNRQADFDNIREIISQTARLEFKILDDDQDFFGPVAKTAKPETLPEGLEFRQEVAPVGLDDSGEQKTKTNTFAYLPRKEKEESKATLRRLREWVATLPMLPDREVGFQLMRETDPDTMKETEAGYRTFLLRSRADISGDMIRDAVSMPDQSGGGLGGWHVALTFTDQGGRIFEQITGANIKRRFAIILDNRIESAPVIQTRIPGGHAQITMGSGDPEVQLKDSRKLELVLRSGALPAPITPSNEQRIGPTLGADSIKSGFHGAVLGSGMVLLFMFLYYKRAGLIADVAVLLNMFLQLAILASFGASMTLPGIMGLALTVGMGVDANVLINERIREEIKEGKSPRAAVEIGYNRAFSAIFDGHITTLISGVVLAQYGTGPVKGFAVTLIVGVAASLFTGVVVSRVLFDLWTRGFMSRDAKLDLG
ncbi:MAG: protein translocase subunit SecD [Polyangiaceae bacterium]